MKLIVLVAMLGLSLAAPQGLDPDAEVIPGGLRPSRRRPTTRDGDDGFEILVFEPRARPNIVMTTLLRDLLGLRRSLGENNRGNSAPATVPPEDDPKPRQESDDTPLLFFDRPFFPEVFRRPLFPRVSFPRLPSFDSFPDIPNLPANYDNVTHEVKIVNGSRVEMNRTITKTTNDNGNVFFTQVQTFRRLPEASPDDDSEVSAAGGESLDSPAETDTQAPKSGRVPEGNTVDNQVELYEDFGVSK